MKKQQLLVGLTVILSLATAAAPVAITAFEGAHRGVAHQELLQLDSVQAAAQSFDGGYAPALADLTTGTYGLAASFHPGAEVFYATNADRSRWIAATKLPAGGVVVKSDESDPVKCAEFNAECAAAVSSDASLIATLPVWIMF